MCRISLAGEMDLPRSVLESTVSDPTQLEMLLAVHREVLATLEGQDVSKIALALYLSKLYRSGETNHEKLLESALRAFSR
jgi:hypothetical protein